MARLYQTKQNLGGTPDSVLSTKDGASEYNSPRDEISNSVVRAKLTPAPADGVGEVFTQVAQAMLINGAGASSFQAAGTVDVITLTPVTGITGLVIPPDYTSLHGFRVGFYPIGANTGNVTISIGQDAGSQFGVKKALNNDGSEIVAGTLTNALYVEFIYDETADASVGAFVLVPYTLASGGGGGGDTAKVDKDLFSDVDYVPKVTLDGTETFYIDDNGVPKKVTSSTVSSGGIVKVDKDLSDNVDYVPTALIDDTDDFYVDKAGTPSKISGLDLKAVLSPPSSQAKAWVKFNGLGVAAINDSFNVSSVFDLPTNGLYAINFTVNFANADYAATGMSQTDTGGNSFFVGYFAGVGATVSTLQVLTVSDSGTNFDVPLVSIICFGEQ